MQLISLTANQASFKPVFFKNQTGLNFIVADKTEITDGKNKTVNGVGKSLLIAIVHFCLGSRPKSTFISSLPDWEFSLTFIVNGKQYASVRDTQNQNKIILNGDTLSVANFNKKFGEELFDVDGTKELTFRSLLPFFIRPRRGSYLSFKDPNTSKKDYQILITNSFLLGLDIRLVEKKFELKKEKDRIKNLIKELKQDTLLKGFFTENTDVSLEEQELDEKIYRLEKDLASFQIAEDYYDIKKEADALKRRIDKIQNHIVLLENQLISIEESRKLHPDIKKDSIERIYKEASVIINESALKHLEDLERFYSHLTTNREKRLLDQKRELLKEIENISAEEDVLKKKFNDHLKYLDTHQALDVFVQLTNSLSDLKSKSKSLKQYDELIKEYHQAKNKVDIDFIEATEAAELYLDDYAEIIKKLRDFFRELSKRFYPDATAGLTINNNSSENQIRFDFDAKIQADSSDGINSIKLFCYDLTLLLKGHGHRMNVLFHDSRLLDGVDPRQSAELFRILKEYILTNNKQYILTVNQNQLDEIKQHLEPDEYTFIIDKNITHHLKDDSPSNKLLGIQVDMTYE